MMTVVKLRTLFYLGVAAALMLSLEGCYYMQAIRGQMDLMKRRRPVTEVIADEQSPPELRSRLAVVVAARQFSIDELLLPDNDSYRSYADLEREHVVWNVFAAPEFSLEAKRWCYPVAGCVAYRGYFSEEAAHHEAQKLNEKGFDVVVVGVPAYSTLGKFADPVLNTMMRWSDADLVATLFHELAHQKLYIKGDAEFNESYATAVSDIGIERWLQQRGEQDQLQGRELRRQQRSAGMRLIEAARKELHALYSSDLDDVAMRQQKANILQGLVDGLSGVSPGWLSGTLNNARLASLGLYEGRLPSFRAIFRHCGEQLACFYEQAAQLADLPLDERNQRLDKLAAGATASVSVPAGQAVLRHR